MKLFPFYALLFEQATPVATEKVGKHLRIEVDPGTDLGLYVSGEVTAANGAAAPFGVRFELETSLNGTHWFKVATVGEKTDVGAFDVVDRDIEAEGVLRLVRVKAVPFSNNGSKPLYKAAVSVVATRSVSAKPVK